MNRHLLQAALLSLLFMLAQLFGVAPAQAAPGNFLLLWGSQQHFSDPGGVAVGANGNVYVTDTDKIHVFNSSGNRIAKWGSYGSGNGQLSYPNGIAADATGTIYVADTGNGRISVFDSTGRFLRSWSSPRWTTNPPIAVASDGKGKVFVAESGTDGLVQAFTSLGIFLNGIGTQDHPCSSSGGVAVDTDGNVYASDPDQQKVQVYSPDGAFLRTAAEWYWGYGIAVDQSRNVYVVDASPPGFSVGIAIFDSAGVLTRSLYVTAEDHGASLEREHFWIPNAVAVGGTGNVYALDSEDSGLSGFDSAGNYLRQWWAWGAWPGQMSYPQGLAIDGSGNVYETDSHHEETAVTNDRVQVFSGDGKSIARWMVGVTQTSGITIDQSGYVNVLDTVDLDSWISDYPGDVARVFDRSGNFVRAWGGSGRDCYLDGPPCAVYGIATAKTGNFIVTHPSVSGAFVYDSAGSVIKELQSPDGFGKTGGVAVNGNGEIFIADTGNSRIQVFDAAYNFIRKWGSPGSGDGQLSAPEGVAIDPAGRVFVADTGNNRVQVFDSAGKFLQKWGGKGDDNGLFSAPEGIALTPDGTKVYVADTGNNRIQLFEGYPAASYSVSGTVRIGSATGPFLAGATVAIAGKTATTTSTGTFTITGIAPGTYTLTISKQGYATRTVTGFVVNGDITGAWYYLFPVYTLSGTVRQGSATGPVLAGATVAIAGKTATTSSTGTFSITGIVAGTYTVTISRSGYVTKTVTGYAVSGNQSGVVFYLSPAYSISGTVRVGSTTGPVLSGATVAIAGKTATTSSTGTFSITGIAAGTYTVTISKTGYVTRTITGFVISGNRSGLVYYLSPAYTISGTVRQGSSTGPVLAGATVAIAGKSATTSSTGTFSITGIAAGTYTLTISKSGYATKTVTGYVISGNKSGLVFYLTPVYTLSGTVRAGSATGPLLAGATVAIAGKTSVTSSTGAFTITGIPAGTYTVTISKTGYVTRTITGYVISGNRTGVVFYLSR